MAMALVFLVFATVVAAPKGPINSGPGLTWPVMQIGPPWLTQLIAAAAVGALGAAGGFFSGLINTRDSSTTLGEYRTSMLKLALKPLVGAVASVTLYIFLDWQVTGVRIVNGGTFLLVGFLAGFSERYFLKVVQAPSEDNDQQKMQRQDRLASVRDQLVSTIAGSPLPPSNTNGRPRFGGAGLWWPTGMSVDYGWSRVGTCGACPMCPACLMMLPGCVLPMPAAEAAGRAGCGGRGAAGAGRWLQAQLADLAARAGQNSQELLQAAIFRWPCQASRVSQFRGSERAGVLDGRRVLGCRLGPA